ncbi:dermonecrotic toxin domain-containing protein [Pseudomonas sp. NPDC089758]|uniref:dermonecrotic toxin domain-containing protein n=1 Tax=Pseudomonas sp. NPDC089758 TaxID=3364473 RepID=UPI00381413F6
MTSIASNPVTRHEQATDAFIAARLPVWLKRASQPQIAALRANLNAHHASQARLRGLTLTLEPLQQFAEKHLSAVLIKPLPAGMTLAGLEWLQVSPRIGTLPGTFQQTYRYSAARQNGLLRLMSNFGPDESFFQGTGLVPPGRDTLLTGTPEQLVETCRALDVGQLYQTELQRIFSATTQDILAQDKRSGLALAAQVATLKGDIDEQVQQALRKMVEGGGAHPDTGLHGYPGLLEMLGQRVADGLFIRLRDGVGNDRGVVVYLPSDPVQALRRFDSTEAMNTAMVAALQEKAYRDYFLQLISLRHRASVAGVLSGRLRDARPDLALKGATAPGDLFAALAAQQLQRVKDDARLLLVPTADADTAAARARHAAWHAAGLDLFNLAGLFIPAVGALLLGQLVAQTLGEVFEGVEDWVRGHQHEALEHMLGVAETVAATGVTAAAVSFLRSSFVDGLQPVNVGGGVACCVPMTSPPTRPTPAPSPCVTMASMAMATGAGCAGASVTMKYSAVSLKPHTACVILAWTRRTGQRCCTTVSAAGDCCATSRNAGATCAGCSTPCGRSIRSLMHSRRRKCCGLPVWMPRSCGACWSKTGRRL